uniref:Coenzyme Q-binding protein COQ10 START domain-containing protein n=1 Tax=Quercus lobata TaxID=97700 RepID=A0A7N2MJ45_QUELO
MGGWCGEIRDVIFSDNGGVTVVYRFTIRGSDGEIGQQNLAFGLKFNAKGIVDCYERELESLPFGQKRDIEFKMIEGDFQLFEGKWSIEQFLKASYDLCWGPRLMKTGGH